SSHPERAEIPYISAEPIRPRTARSRDAQSVHRRPDGFRPPLPLPSRHASIRMISGRWRCRRGAVRMRDFEIHLHRALEVFGRIAGFARTRRARSIAIGIVFALLIYGIAGAV